MDRKEIIKELGQARRDIDVLISCLTEDEMVDKEKTIGEDLRCYENLFTTDYESVIVELFDKYGEETTATFLEEFKKEN